MHVLHELSELVTMIPHFLLAFNHWSILYTLIPLLLDMFILILGINEEE